MTKLKIKKCLLSISHRDETSSGATGLCMSDDSGAETSRITGILNEAFIDTAED